METAAAIKNRTKTAVRIKPGYGKQKPESDRTGIGSDFFIDMIFFYKTVRYRRALNGSFLRLLRMKKKKLCTVTLKTAFSKSKNYRYIGKYGSK